MGNIFFNYKVGNQYLTEDITIPFLIIIGIYLAVVITFYVFRSIGLYVLAKRNGVKKAFLAWIPFLWINIACKLAGDFRIFSKKISELTLLFTILFTVGEVLSLFYMFLDYFPLIGYFLSGGSIYFGTAPTIEHLTYSSSGLTGTYVLSNYVNPYASIDFTLFYAIIETLDIITMILSLVTIFIKVNVFISIFRKFWPQHFILASIFSLIVGIRGILMHTIILSLNVCQTGLGLMNILLLMQHMLVV